MRDENTIPTFRTTPEFKEWVVNEGLCDDDAHAQDVVNAVIAHKHLFMPVTKRSVMHGGPMRNSETKADNVIAELYRKALQFSVAVRGMR